MASGRFTFGTITSTSSTTSASPSSSLFSLAQPTFTLGTPGTLKAVTTSSTSTTTTSTTAQVLRPPQDAFATLLSAADKGAKEPEFRFGQKLLVNKEPDDSSEEEFCNAFFPKPLAPWRAVEWTEEERSSLLEKLSSYIPSSRDVPQARILLLGPVGSGKSSFISSIQSVFDGRVTTRAMVGHSASSSFTRKLQSFPLRVRDSTRGRSTALVLCDMMGFGDGVLGAPTLQHMLGVIGGHAPEGYTFRPDQALSSDTEGYIKRPTLRQQMHCVAFVLDASKVRSGSYSKEVTDTFQQLRRYISDMGVHQVVLLTHVDKMCSETAKDTSAVYKSIFVRDTVYKAAELVGISVSSVVPVRNYWCELDLELTSDVLLLKALDHIVQYAELLFTEERGTSSSEDKH